MHTRSAPAPGALRERFFAAPPLQQFIQDSAEHGPLWRAVAARARRTGLPAHALARAQAIGAPRHLLVLLEDWCLDAVNTIPVLDALVDDVPAFTLRVLSRDANDDLMQAHLSTTGARAIPVVIVYDAEFRELGWWGARPTPLQAWTESDEARALDKTAQNVYRRRWYVQDGGGTTLDEVLTILERE